MVSATKLAGIPLTDPFVKKVTEPGRYGDGRGGLGLSLRVHVTKIGRLAKFWHQRLWIDGKYTTATIGSFPRVRLAEAREKALNNLRALDRGEDPRTRVKGTKAIRVSSSLPTFAELVEPMLEIKAGKVKPGSRTPQQMRTLLTQHALPTLGDLPIDQINRSHTTAVLEVIAKSLPQTSEKVKQAMSAVFEHAKCKDLRGDNPTRDIRAVMPELPDSDGMKAIPNEEVPAAVKAIRESDAKPSARLALELIALTGLRNSEARKATFAEIDLESRIWTVPGLKMKGKKNRPDFRVPLSDRAVEIVLEARSLANGGEYLFPNAKGTNAIAPSYLAATLTQLGIECDVHGFRQNLTNYCAQTGVGDSIRKRLLDHVTGNKVDQAYQTDDLLDQRRAVLDAWADVVGGDTTTNPSGNL